MTDQSEPVKPFGFELNPKVEVLTSIGPVFVYETDHNTVDAYAKQAAGDAPAQMRAYLAQSSSTTERKTPDEKVSLTEDQARSLTDDDVEKLASAYLGTMNNKHYIAKAKAAKPGLQRDAGQPSVGFLDRLLRWRAEDSKREMKKFLEEARGGAFRNALDQARGLEALRGIDATRTLFEEAQRTRETMDRMFGGGAYRTIADLHENASGLSKLIEDARRHRSAVDELRDSGAFQHFTRPKDDILGNIVPPAPPLRMPTVRDTLREVTDDINEAAERRDEQRQAQREEDLQINRHISDVTLKSSELLAQLSQASATMLEKFGIFLADFRESASQSGKSARWGIWIAAGSLAFTAVLSSIALGYAIASYKQDKANNVSNDKWQAEVAGSFKSQAAWIDKARQDLAIENGQLRQRLDALEKAALAKTKPASKKSKIAP